MLHITWTIHMLSWSVFTSPTFLDHVILGLGLPLAAHLRVTSSPLRSVTNLSRTTTAGGTRTSTWKRTTERSYSKANNATITTEEGTKFMVLYCTGRVNKTEFSTLNPSKIVYPVSPVPYARSEVVPLVSGWLAK